jgi:Sec-independent protein translocase protein TatA
VNGSAAGYGASVTKTNLLAVTVVAALLSGCGPGDLQDLAKDTEAAIKDAGAALDKLAGEARGPLRDAASRALDAAQGARRASEEFRKNPTTETRQALRRAKQRLDDVSRELEGLLDHAPEAVRSVLQHALDSLTELRHRVQRELDSS